MRRCCTSASPDVRLALLRASWHQSASIWGTPAGVCFAGHGAAPCIAGAARRGLRDLRGAEPDFASCILRPGAVIRTESRSSRRLSPALQSPDQPEQLGARPLLEALWLACSMALAGARPATEALPHQDAVRRVAARRHGQPRRSGSPAASLQAAAAIGIAAASSTAAPTRAAARPDGAAIGASGQGTRHFARSEQSGRVLERPGPLARALWRAPFGHFGPLWSCGPC